MKLTLRAARVNAGLTQEAASKALNVDRTTVIRWESGAAWPQARKIPQICELYGIQEDELRRS